MHPIRPILTDMFAGGHTAPFVHIILSTPLLLLAGGLGFPPHVLRENPEHLPLLFNDPRMFTQMGPWFFDDRLEVTLSFDMLYRVTIPYCVVVLSQQNFGTAPYIPKVEDSEPAEAVSKRPAFTVVGGTESGVESGGPL